MIWTCVYVGSGFYLMPDIMVGRRILVALAGADTVAGDAVTGLATDGTHFAHAGGPQNHEGVASFRWDTLGLPDDDYLFAALCTEGTATALSMTASRPGSITCATAVGMRGGTAA